MFIYRHNQEELLDPSYQSLWKTSWMHIPRILMVKLYSGDAANFQQLTASWGKYNG